MPVCDPNPGKIQLQIRYQGYQILTYLTRDELFDHLTSREQVGENLYDIVFKMVLEIEEKSNG